MPGMSEPSPCSPLESLAERVRAVPRELPVRGASGAVAPLVIAQVAEARSDAGPTVVVCRDEARAQQLIEEIHVFFRPASASDEPLAPAPVLGVPEVDVSPYSDLAPDRRTLYGRQAALFRFLQGYASPVTVLSVRSLMRRVVPPAPFDARCELVVQGEELDREQFTETLLRAGYQRLPVVEDPGTFTVRGGVVDFYPPVYRDPVRLELEGDTVVALRLYDPESQRTQRTVDHAYVHPVRETLVTEGARPRERLLRIADAAHHPSSRTRFLLSQIEEGADFFGADSLVSIFHRELESLFAYVPEDALWVLEEPDALRHEVESTFAGYEEAYQERLAQRQLAVPPAELFLRPEALERRLQAAPRVTLAAVVDEAEAWTLAPVTFEAQPHTTLVHEVRQRQATRGQEVLGPLAEALSAAQAESRPTVVVSPDSRAAARLRALLERHGIQAAVASRRQGYGLPVPGEQDRVEIRVGHLARGFTLPPPGPAVFAEEELFGAKVRRARPRQRGLPRLGDLSELHPGDFVVHQLHGVGRYEGLQREQVGDVAGDFMVLTYRDDARLYLPVHRFGEVHRYVAAEGRPPRLDRLGGATWQRSRRKVSASVRKLAEALLQLYAQREALPGHAAGAPDELYEAFEATFPFTETPDQRAAIEAVQGDMMTARPMDRLVCGDVGYGKTEVALRAAVLAVLDGRQVAMLAPTTVLVEQHLSTFTERLKHFPVRVAGLSRFRARGTQQRTLEALAAGEVDIVIGTHRLLSKDVHFKHLGLVVVDEEQRFGVAHKERLKTLRTQVDVLTLTATPIPRTLHMSLLGLRDLSLITTPPSDRLAVRTHVSVTSPQVVRDGIRRELARGGQVYFVVPRISAAPGAVGSRPTPSDPEGRGSLHWWAEEIRRLTPEARVAEAHGQLDDRSLERVMAEFVAGRHDVLVCTSLVESGLDISRANTMFIQHADYFGLAQLYQLRGRIGRGRERAHCLLMVDSLSAITPEARQRLEALQRFSDLGAGFNLASTDLEIRGTGDLLGGRQSGNIASVGFEEYTRIMEEAVAELRGEPLDREDDPDLISDLPSFIPDDYLDDPGQRLHFYRRFADIADEQDAEGLVAEMADRFGHPPPEVPILADLMVIKTLVRRLRARSVEIIGSRLTLTLDERTRLDPAVVADLVTRQPRRYTLTQVADQTYKLVHRLKAEGDEARLSGAKNCLHDLLAGVR